MSWISSEKLSTVRNNDLMLPTPSRVGLFIYIYIYIYIGKVKVKTSLVFL